VPSEDVWLSGVFGGKSVSMECITGQSERSRADFRHFQASFEDLLLHVILDVSHVQRIRDLLVMRYINVRFTYLLTKCICKLQKHDYSSDAFSRWDTGNLTPGDGGGDSAPCYLVTLIAYMILASGPRVLTASLTHSYVDNLYKYN